MEQEITKYEEWDMKFQQEKDIVIITTGTNGEKAITLWDIDAVVEFTYFELLVNKSLQKSK